MTEDYGRRAADLLKRLVACDTSNPPGRETQAAALVADYLGAAGVPSEIVAKDPERGNLVARLRGGDGPTLMFLGHLDVVPAEQRGWSVAPFAGVERDGAIWGRGTVDMKCQVASVAVALAELASSGTKPPGDVLLVAVADEEVGTAEVGTPWLVEERPDIRTDFAIGEGAGERYDVPGGPMYLLDVGVKQGSKVTLRVTGRAGDASLPGLGSDALRPLADLVGRVPHFVGDPIVGPEAEAILAAAAPGDGGLAQRLERARAANGYLGQLVEALMRTTVVPVRVEASGPFNVVTDTAECLLQCALPPEVGQAELEAHLREAIGPGDYELEASEPLGGSRSPAESPLRDAIEGFLAENDPEARLVPTLGYGYSDCHVLRETFGTTTYGFIPFRHAPAAQNLETKHGPDERVLVADLDFQVRCALHVARTLGA